MVINQVISYMKCKTTGSVTLMMKIILVLSAMAVLQVSQGQPQEKIDSLLTLIKTGEKNSDRVSSLYELAKQYYYSGNYENAMKYARNSLELAQEMNLSSEAVNAYIIIGLLYDDQGNYPAALENYSSSYSLAEETGYKMGILNSLSGLGAVNNHQGNPKEGLNNFLKALEIALEIGDKSKAASLYGNLGTTYHALGNFPEALKNQKQSLHLAEATGDKRVVSTALLNIGNIYISMGNIPEALNQYLAALKVKEELGDKIGIASAYFNLALIYSRMDNKTEQLINLRAALRIYEEIGHRKGIIIAYNQMGNIYLDEGDFENALEYFRISLEISEEIGDKTGIATAYNNISVINRRQGNYTEALENKFAALEIRREIGAIEEVSNSLIGLAEIYRYMGDHRLARKYTEECLELSKRIGNKRDIKGSYFLLSTLDSLEGKFEMALEHYKFYILYRDSLLNQESKSQITQLQIQFETEKKDKEIDLLNKDNEIKTLQISRQKAVRHGLIAGIVLLFIAGYLLFRSFRLRKKLEQQQAIISERRRISADLHDDVGSGLSRIMLLTELVKNEAKTPETRKEAEKIASISKELSANISEIIWALNANNDNMESLLAYIRRYAAEFFENSAVKLKINTTGDITQTPISGDLRREIFYSVKEALHNIYKHSQATEAALDLSVTEDALEVVIRDNGIGMPEKQSGQYGNGISNMHQRMASAGGSISIENHHGTRITLRVPV